MLRISLSGCGWLFPYHVGVLQGLKRSGVIIRSEVEEVSSVVYSGVSGGSLIAVAEAAGISSEDQLDAANAANRAIRKNPRLSFWGSGRAVLRDVLNDLLPHDVHLLIRGRVEIGIQKRLLGKAHVFTDFRSKDDLIGAILASCHVPVYMDGRTVFCQWRGTEWVDGGLWDILPPSPSHMHSQTNEKSNEGRVAMTEYKSLPYYPMAYLRGDQDRIISPRSSEFGLFGELLSWTFVPPSDVYDMHRLAEVGCADARRFLKEEKRRSISGV